MHVMLAEADLSSMLFENPWPAVIALVGVSSVLRVIGKRQNQKRLVIASYAALALGLGVYATAALVNTDREQLIERTEALISATSPVDESALRDLFSGNAVLLKEDGGLWRDLDAGLVAERLRQANAQDHTLRAVEAVSNRPGQGISTMDVSSRVGGVPNRSTWEIVWLRDEDGRWRISSLRWLTLNRQSPNPMFYQ